MTKEEILSITKKIIKEEIEKEGYEVKEIILFGSRARGEEKPDSDWDFYVLVNKEIDFKTKKRIAGLIQMRLAENYIFCDILINSVDRYNILKKEKSTISYLCNIEGINI